MALKRRITTPLDGPGVQLWEWTAVNDGDSPEPVVVGQFQDKSVQVVGVTAGGGTITVQGSMDTDPATSDWHTLNDPQGNALSFSTDRTENILEHVYQVRPTPTGTSNATVRLLLASSR